MSNVNDRETIALKFPPAVSGGHHSMEITPVASRKPHVRIRYVVTDMASITLSLSADDVRRLADALHSAAAEADDS
jgi:hypothetical protein